MHSKWSQKKKNECGEQTVKTAYQSAPGRVSAFTPKVIVWELVLGQAEGRFVYLQGHKSLAYPFRGLLPPATPAWWPTNRRTLRYVIMTLSPETARWMGQCSKQQ